MHTGVEGSLELENDSKVSQDLLLMMSPGILSLPCRILIGVFLQLFQQFTGMNVIMYVN